MKFISDFHIHSHYSIATSNNLIPEYLEYWARIKGINVIGTGDCIHPGWLSELREKLEPAGNGMYRLKSEYRLDESVHLNHENIPSEVFFILTGEISNIYKKNGKVRKVHNLTVFPDFDAVEYVQAFLDKIGNIRSDGRPILGLDSRVLLEQVLESSDNSYLIPAHIWTPWFSVLGSKSGFNRVEECYEDLTRHIFAVETGLSSDPAMNWACSFLDRFKLVSNSDAHSPGKLGREANLFDTDISYQAIYDSLKGNDGFLGTIEFFPQEGKYHYDGHRKCNIQWNPLETIKHNGICPACGKPVTRGVMYRIAELADRSEIENAPGKKDFYSITQLPDLLAEMFRQKSSNTKRVMNEYHSLIGKNGSEFYLLLFADLDEIKLTGGELLAEGIRRLRNGEVLIEEGYDGEFGRIKVFHEEELDSFSGNSLFNIEKPDYENIKRESKWSIKFNVSEFQSLSRKYNEGNENLFSMVNDAAEKKFDSTGVGFSLSDKQKQGIEHFEGPCMVIAGPGSGKTGILTERIVNLIKEKDISADNILAVTFSNKAALEMRERVKRKMSLPNLNISTFHAFGLSILKSHFDKFDRQIDFYIIDNAEKTDILENIVKDKRKIKTVINRIESLKQGNELIETVDGILTDNIIIEYNNELKNRNSFDINDLITLPGELLKNNPEIAKSYREQYPWIMIDEYQDVNAAQYRLVCLLAGRGNPNLFVIGDPNQAIYGFRGSDVRFIDRLQEDYPDIKMITLTESYRCPDPVLKAAGQILQKKGTITGKTQDLKVRIQETGTDKSEADWIASQIERMIGGVRSFSIDSGISDGEAENASVSFSDFSVLCRTAFMFELFIEAFMNHGIAYQVIGNEPFYMKEPYVSAINLLRNIYYQRSYKIITDDARKKLTDMIMNWAPVFEVMKMIMEDNGASGEELKRINGLALPFGDNYDDFFRAIIMRQGIDDWDERAEAVSLMTLHASKGLEFNTVFIPGCEGKIIPFELFGKKSADELNEEERLFYVGITRTRENLYLTYAKKRLYRGRALQQKRSPFLDRLEEDLLAVGKRKPMKRGRDDDAQLDLF